MTMGNGGTHPPRERGTGALPESAAMQGTPWPERAMAMPGDPGWRIEEGGDGYEPALEHAIESRLALGNGFLGARGALELPAPASRPCTFVAGLFAAPTDPLDVPTLVPLPGRTDLQLTVGGTVVPGVVSGAPGPRRTLDLARGVLLGEATVAGPGGQVVRLRTLRFVSSADRALAVQVAIIVVDRPVRLALAIPAIAAGEELRVVCAGEGWARWRVAGGTRQVAMAERASLRVGRLAITPEDNERGRCWRWLATPDAPATFWRVVAAARAEGDDGGVVERARGHLRRAVRTGPRRLLDAHARAWAARSQAGDVAIDGDGAAQRALRFAVYHLSAAANPADDRVSIGARALTGEAYRGHVFWDTECFLLPFYTLTWPAAARALLRYRHRTLPAARAKAARLGYRGALYAWESTDTGEEATPTEVLGPRGEAIPIRCGIDEQHIAADVALAVWRYWEATRDVPFLLDAGAEIVLETARFWASRAAVEDDRRYHIRGVIGPDEYHEGVDDNAYTNGMAAWNLERGAEVAALLSRRWPARWATLNAALGLEAGEIAAWQVVAAGLVTGFDPATGLIEQFAGYHALGSVDLAAYAARAAPMDVVLGRERTRQSQVIKQADVVMLLANLPERYAPAVRAANFRHYEPRCGHGSSLSPAIHALAAARLGDVALAARYFAEAGAIDLDDALGNAAGGVHLAALGGLWQAAVFGFAGLAFERAGLRLAPHLPPSWRALRFAIRWRGRLVRIALERAGPDPVTVRATLERGRPLTLRLGAARHRLLRGVPLIGSIAPPEGDAGGVEGGRR